MEMVLLISTSRPNSLAPASAPSTISRLIADAKIRMNIDDNKKYAINVQRAAASRMTSSMLAMRTFIPLSFYGRELYHEKSALDSRRWRSLRRRLLRADQVHEHVLEGRAHRRQLAEHAAAGAELVHQRVEVLHSLDRQYHVPVDPLHPRPRLAEGVEERVIDGRSHHLVFLGLAGQ